LINDLLARKWKFGAFEKQFKMSEELHSASWGWIYWWGVSWWFDHVRSRRLNRRRWILLCQPIIYWQIIAWFNFYHILPVLHNTTRTCKLRATSPRSPP
jgi:hypothetical protein